MPESDLATLPETVVPRERAGSQTAARYDFQANFGILKLVELRESGKDFRVVFDIFDDIMVLDPAEAPIQMRPGADGVSLITADGVYDASLLLADALWSSGQIEVEGDIVVAAPAKGPLLVTGSRNRAGIARLRALAAELAAGPYGLTPALFVWRGGKFVVFDGK